MVQLENQIQRYITQINTLEDRLSVSRTNLFFLHFLLLLNFSQVKKIIKLFVMKLEPFKEIVHEMDM